MARRSKNPKTSAKVGYGKPPKHSQFKKGQSGNPKGRPKKSHNLDTYLEEAIMAPVIIHNSGKKQEVPTLQALAMRMMNNALNGDKAALKSVFDLIIRRGLAGSAKAEEEQNFKTSTGIDEELERMIEKALREDELSGPETAPSSDKPAKKEAS